MPSTAALPHCPPATFDDLAPLGGRLGPDPEDFVVDERPLYRPSGSGHHRYVRVRKRGWTTPAMVQTLAKAAGVFVRDVGYAGMKDRHAVTTQWISLPATSRPPEEWDLPVDLEVLEHALHDNKLRTGHLAGNHFVLQLVDVEPANLEHVDRWRERLTHRGYPNYFGFQRFGAEGANLERAFRWLSSLDRGPPGQEGHGRRRRRRREDFNDKLYSSVLQSEIFNQYLTARIRRGLDQLLDGEVVRLDGSTKVFVVEDPAHELERWRSLDIHLTGPLPGPKMRQPQGDAARLELSVIEGLGLSASHLAHLGRHAPGTRRDLLVRPEGLSFEPLPKAGLRLSFTLPAGAYATELVRQLAGTPWRVARGENSG